MHTNQQALNLRSHEGKSVESRVNSFSKLKTKVTHVSLFWQKAPICQLLGSQVEVEACKQWRPNCGVAIFWSPLSPASGTGPKVMSFSAPKKRQARPFRGPLAWLALSAANGNSLAFVRAARRASEHWEHCTDAKRSLSAKCTPCGTGEGAKRSLGFQLKVKRGTLKGSGKCKATLTSNLKGKRVLKYILASVSGTHT